MKYYRVKYGYGKDDFYSVDEDEMPKALAAQITGKVAILKEGTIAGNSIISIKPDYNRLMGYNREYELTSEDYKEIGRQNIEEHEALLGEAKAQLQSGGAKLLHG